jgi:hypothetical protein
MHLEELTNLKQEDISWMSRQDYFERHGYPWHHVEKILRLYKHYKSIQKAQVDVHHICARSRGWVDYATNKEKMLRGEHVNHHDLFWVQLPHEQIINRIDFNQKVIHRDAQDQVKERVRRLLQKDQFYKPKIIR